MPTFPKLNAHSHAKTSLMVAFLLGAFLSCSELTCAQEKREPEPSPAPAGSNTDEPTTLQQIALERNPLRKAALADTKGTAAGVREARAPLLPRITFAENFTGGNDPVFVFGAKLRQQVFTASDFELNNLNRPTPMGNYASRFFGEWNLFDSTQSWKALDRAKYLNFADNEQLDRTDQELVYQKIGSGFE
jgi:outer membrane protein TolC